MTREQRAVLEDFVRWTPGTTTWALQKVIRVIAEILLENSTEQEDNSSEWKERLTERFYKTMRRIK